MTDEEKVRARWPNAFAGRLGVWREEVANSDDDVTGPLGLDFTEAAKHPSVVARWQAKSAAPSESAQDEVELPPLDASDKERCKAEEMAHFCMKCGVPVEAMETYVLHTAVRERQLLAALAENARLRKELEEAKVLLSDACTSQYKENGYLPGFSYRRAEAWLQRNAPGNGGGR